MADDQLMQSLCEKILEFRNIPKLQVERFVGPILGIFLEKVLTQSLKDDPCLSGDIVILSPEWPLKKNHNDQSTNIDWLMLNQERNMLILVELKTAGTSYNSEQVNLYLGVKKRIETESAQFVYEDVLQIARSSSERSKYDYIIKQIDAHRFDFKACRKCAILYIVPKPIVPNLANKGIDRILAFEDLPREIPGDHGKSWTLLQETLCGLENDQKSTLKISRSNPHTYSADIAAKVKERFPNKTPIKIYFGISGNGGTPNFQVEFADGTLQPFYASGKPYTLVSQFNAKNLSSPINWNEFVDSGIASEQKSGMIVERKYEVFLNRIGENKASDRTAASNGNTIWKAIIAVIIIGSAVLLSFVFLAFVIGVFFAGGLLSQVMKDAKPRRRKGQTGYD